ncbi:undecaprenyldiphospho-muramoylpentapeptide beta-N-acetylglucosaminyltransferase [Helicobacter sp. 11S03491-1]|uniref:undecaprenyldiphospho-muramoylpentapeptide beta-N-acetylglucosaminyltransferase n=1 Tax=Helicobacter sp. 11S03491-1 TaxID=1476196 RepID=UPI000BA7A5A2|nr:undecaprenyldiphospho-muramoylpentapeptide beta-N-acetylglucosaminyltransferase [Helicobacter sp. 11S03491-1]PAF41159.1 undecaprenyldiphospho-muramoylpentapeptide beta-N-acetylglucosaminyltransferase [Helicobacter sp. 11S03491-1]
MNIVITGGGTGGHLAIAKALAQEFQKNDHVLVYIGSLNGQDREWFESSDLFEKCYFLNTLGVVNKKGPGIFKSLWKQVFATFQACKIFKIYKIQTVFSVGGFSGGPASLGALLCNKTLFIHEQNAIKGSLNKLLSPFAKAVFGSFTQKGKNYIKTSYPLRNEFFLKSRIREEIKCVIFLGGSQGARAINDFAILVAKKLLSKGIKVIHQCGKIDFERVKDLYAKLDLLDQVDLFSFDKNLVDKITQADICVGRAGASSVWEIAANGLPAIFIPYPYAASNHQYYNALEFAQDGLGIIARQEDGLYPEILFDFMDKLNSVDKEGIKGIAQISKRLREKIMPNGASRIVKYIV